MLVRWVRAGAGRIGGLLRDVEHGRWTTEMQWRRALLRPAAYGNRASNSRQLGGQRGVSFGDRSTARQPSHLAAKHPPGTASFRTAPSNAPGGEVDAGGKIRCVLRSVLRSVANSVELGDEMVEVATVGRRCEGVAVWFPPGGRGVVMSGWRTSDAGTC